MSQIVIERGYVFSDDKDRLDFDRVYGWLRDETYWAAQMPRKTCDRAVENSLCFGVYGPDQAQIGFCRVVSDYATFAYLCDVFIDTAHRGKGLGKRLMDQVFAHRDLQGLRRWTLFTADAHGLYEKSGFGPVDEVRGMERIDRQVYAHAAAEGKQDVR